MHEYAAQVLYTDDLAAFVSAQNPTVLYVYGGVNTDRLDFLCILLGIPTCMIELAHLGGLSMCEFMYIYRALPKDIRYNPSSLD
jgi:hypothetical protein